MEILDRIKKLCSSKNISVGDLEKELEFSNGSIYKWNKTTPGADKVEKVADYFNVSVDYLLGRTAFKNSFELFEHWGYSAEGFEAAFDFGKLLKAEREKQGISLEEVSRALGITITDVENIEEGFLPLNYEWAEKYANFLDTSVAQIFIDNDMCISLNDIPIDLLHHYHEQGMSEEEMLINYMELKHALAKDQENESHKKYVIDTVAAHLEGKNLTPKKLKLLEQYIDALFDEDDE